MEMVSGMLGTWLSLRRFGSGMASSEQLELPDTEIAVAGEDWAVMPSSPSDRSKDQAAIKSDLS